MPEPSRALLTAFIQRMQEEQRFAAPTIEAYTLDLTALARWASGQQKGFRELGTDDFIHYLDQRREQGVQTATLARQLCSYRRFYSFLLSQGVVAADPVARIEGIEVTRNTQPLLSSPSIALLLRSPVHRADEQAGAGYRKRRDHAMICMLFASSLAVSAIRELRWQHIDAQQRIVTMPLRNGSLRAVPLDDTLLRALAALRIAAAEFVSLDAPFCFPTAAGYPMTRQALGQLVQRWAQECGVRESVTASAIRQAGLVRQAGRWKLRPAIRHEAPELPQVGHQAACM